MAKHRRQRKQKYTRKVKGKRRHRRTYKGKKRRTIKKKTQRGKGFRHLKEALYNRGKESANRIGQHIFNRKLGETFLVPGLRPKYSTPIELFREEIDQAVNQFKKDPVKYLKHGFALLRK